MDAVQTGPGRKLHVIGLPHTVVSSTFSHCAFTGKVLRFAKMMQQHGWFVVEYSNGRSESAASKHVQVLTEKEVVELTLRKSEKEDYSVDIDNNPLMNKLFWERLLRHLRAETAPGDIVCHVFGPSLSVVEAAPQCYHVESGIGYPCCEPRLPYRVFESSVWMHWHLGKCGKSWGENYHFVAPNYYDLEDWEVNLDQGRENDYILFFGRVIHCKGLDVVREVARRCPDQKFVVCGQGTGYDWGGLTNVQLLPPVVGRARSKLLGCALAVLAPSCFVEPFCGSAVEAQLCGTPVITSSFGAFHETVLNEVTGFRCHSLGDYLAAVRRIGELDRRTVAERARRLYSLETVGVTYNQIFRDLDKQAGNGWYDETSSRY